MNPIALVAAVGGRGAILLSITRAIRRYRLDEPIPEADLAAILFAATRAPTGSNRQTFRFVVLRDGGPAREAKGILGEGFRRAWQTKRSEDGYDLWLRYRPLDAPSQARYRVAAQSIVAARDSPQAERFSYRTMKRPARV